MKKYYVYLITNQNNTTLYCGVTNDIYRCINEHNDKVVTGFSEKYKLNKLVYVEEYGCINDALRREKQLKGWRREKKNALINRDNAEWKDLMRE